MERHKGLLIPAPQVAYSAGVNWAVKTERHRAKIAAFFGTLNATAVVGCVTTTLARCDSVNKPSRRMQPFTGGSPASQKPTWLGANPPDMNMVEVAAYLKAQHQVAEV